MIALKPMTEEAYLTWQKSSMESFAQEKIESGTWRAEEALTKANEAFADLLPDGLRTKRHYFYEIIDDRSATVGYIWVALEKNPGSAFLYDLVVLPAMRRRGYGKQAMLVLEERLRELGCDKLSLHVFGHNVIARSLYEKLDFLITDLTMTKSL